jgi:hypothetical protein
MQEYKTRDLHFFNTGTMKVAVALVDEEGFYYNSRDFICKQTDAEMHL